MKTDNIFYKIFATFPHLFFELTGKPQTDPSQYGFKSVTVKETELRMDGLFLPSPTDPEAPLYFVEVQFQPEPNLYYRLMAEIHLYLRQYQPGRPWQAVVFYPSETMDEGLPVEYQALDGIVIQRVYLKELREDDAVSPEVGIVRLVVETPKRAEPWARQLIERSRQVPDETQRSRLLELIETTLAYKFPEKTRKEIAIMFGLEEMKQTRYWQDAQEQEALAYTTRLIKRSLGSIPTELQEAIETLSKSQLEALGEDLFDFTSSGDLSQWLQNPRDALEQTRKEIGLESGEMKQTRYWQDAQEQEAQALVTRLLRRRLGSLDPELQQQVEGLSKSQLEALGEDLIDFTSSGDLSQWLLDPKG